MTSYSNQINKFKIIMKFFIKIFSPIILITSFLLLIFIIYKSEIYWDGRNRNYYFIYYLISLLSLFFSIITFYINKKIKEYLIISILASVLSLYLFEGFLIYKDLYSKEEKLKELIYEKQTGNKWDRRKDIEIYRDLKKTNNNITIKVAPFFFVNKNYSLFPVSGISNSVTIFNNENGYYSIYKSDRYGFNNPDSEWDKKEIEYMILGDSFAHGCCVNRPNDISSVLRNLTKKSVINLAYSANGPLIEFATLREYLNTNVKKVLWIYYEGNDLLDLEYEKKNNILVNYLNNLNFTQNLKFKQNEIDKLGINILHEKETEIKNEKVTSNFKNKFKKFIKIYNLRALIFPSQQPSPPPEFKKILTLAKNFVEENNSKLFFIYLPEYYRYKTRYNETNYNLVKNIVSDLKIPFIDIHKEVFKKQQNPLQLFPFELFGHYNVEGYKQVAETIYKLTKD